VCACVCFTHRLWNWPFHELGTNFYPLETPGSRLIYTDECLRTISSLQNTFCLLALQFKYSGHWIKYTLAAVCGQPSLHALPRFISPSWAPSISYHPALYSGGLGFKSRPGDLLSWPRLLVVFLSPSSRMPG
jgi:hypothetical protein